MRWLFGRRPRTAERQGSQQADEKKLEMAADKVLQYGRNSI
ncbi:MAG TPA: hypothetical protein VF525_02925 [Pyrinomonadaceae bacterium]